MHSTTENQFQEISIHKLQYVEIVLDIKACGSFI